MVTPELGHEFRDMWSCKVGPEEERDYEIGGCGRLHTQMLHVREVVGTLEERGCSRLWGVTEGLAKNIEERKTIHGWTKLLGGRNPEPEMTRKKM